MAISCVLNIASQWVNAPILPGEIRGPAAAKGEIECVYGPGLCPAGADIPSNIGVDKLDLGDHFELGYRGFSYIHATYGIITKETSLMIFAFLGNGLETGRVSLVTVKSQLYLSPVILPELSYE